MGFGQTNLVLPEHEDSFLFLLGFLLLPYLSESPLVWGSVVVFPVVFFPFLDFPGAGRKFNSLLGVSDRDYN